jgi:ATP-dependent Clp protease ATP-binding subunit ClpC
VFERYTDRARRVIVLGQEEARLLNHNYIGTEHLLLGLLKEGEGIGAQALTLHSVDMPALRSAVEEKIGKGTQAPSGHIPFTPRAKKVMELSLREALQLGHNYIGTEHILLGLIREGEGMAAQVLADRGIKLNDVRKTILNLVGKQYEQRRAVLHEEYTENPQPTEVKTSTTTTKEEPKEILSWQANCLCGRRIQVNIER